MKRIAFFIAGAILATILFLAFSATAKGSTREGDCAWPASLDPVAATPGDHRVVLENDRVRVLDVTVQPDERENVHAHCRQSVMYLMYEGIHKD